MKKKTLHSLAELKEVRDLIKMNYIEPVPEGTFTGAQLKNPSYNKLFLWKFSKKHVDQFIAITDKFKEQSDMGIKSVNAMIANLELVADELFDVQSNPIECMLYASKTMNAQIDGDPYLLSEMAELVYRLILKDKDAGLEVLDHIISNWTWKPQQKIAIVATGKLGNYDLLAKIHRKYSNEPYMRYETFVALLDSANIDLLYAIEEIVSNLNGDNEIDCQIGSYFANNFKANFGFEGTKEMEFFFQNSKHISPHSKKVLAKVCTIVNDDDLTRSMIIQLAKQSDPKYDNSDKEKEYCFSRLIDILNKTDTANGIFAMRFVHTPAAIQAVSNKLKEIRYIPGQERSIQWGIMTLGFLNAYGEIDLIKSFIGDPLFCNHVWAALILLKDNTYIPDLVLSLFNTATSRIAQDVINQVLKASHELRTVIIDTFSNILKNQGEVDQLSVILCFKDLLQRPNTKSLISTNLVSQLCSLMGLNQNTISVKGDGNQSLMLDLIKECMSVSPDTEMFQKLLFLIIEDKAYSMKIKATSNKILQDPIVFPIKPPEA